MLNTNTGNAPFPLPIDTPICEDLKYSSIKFGGIWNRFFKAIVDALLKSRQAQNALDDQRSKGFKYVVNGCLISCVWVRPSTTTSDIVIELPFPSLFPFQDTLTQYPANTKTITIAASTTYTSFWYLANLEAKGA